MSDTFTITDPHTTRFQLRRTFQFDGTLVRAVIVNTRDCTAVDVDGGRSDFDDVVLHLIHDMPEGVDWQAWALQRLADWEG
jgi:hypothetical protein